MASLPRIGWIGAGRMGVPMAGFILKAGFPLTVFSRSAASRQKLIAHGAREALSIAQCARAADVIFAAVADDEALRDVALGPNGVLANAQRAADSREASNRAVARRPHSPITIFLTGSPRQHAAGSTAEW